MTATAELDVIQHVMETKPTKRKSADKQTATVNYRNLVIRYVNENRDGEPDGAVLEAAGRYLKDFVADCATYDSRRRAMADLERAQALLMESAAVPPDTDGGDVPVAGMTVGQLAVALSRFQRFGDPTCPGPNTMRAHELRTQALTIRNQAMQVLQQTADPELRLQIAALGAEEANLENRVRSQEKLLIGSKQREGSLGLEIQQLAGKTAAFARSRRRLLERELERQIEATAKIADTLKKEQAECGEKLKELHANDTALRQRLERAEDLSWC